MLKLFIVPSLILILIIIFLVMGKKSTYGTKTVKSVEVIKVLVNDSWKHDVLKNAYYIESTDGYHYTDVINWSSDDNEPKVGDKIETKWEK